MLWAILSFFSAVTQSSGNALIKDLTKKISILVLFFSTIIFFTPILLVLMFFTDIPKIDYIYIILTIISAVLVLIGNIFYFKSLKESPMSLCMPLLALTPFFLLILSMIFLKEIPNIYGIIGILLVVFGSYFLNLKDIKQGIFKPFKAIFTGKGASLALLGSSLFAISSTIDKRNLNLTNPIFYLSSKFFVFLIVFIIIFIKKKPNIKNIKSNWKKVLLLNILSVISQFCLIFAMSLGYISYVISIRRSSILFDVGYGHFVFKEKETKQRFIGAVVILIGLVMITFFTNV
jgi:drug/metabolite transporter (DMT)-like permease